MQGSGEAALESPGKGKKTLSVRCGGGEAVNW